MTEVRNFPQFPAIFPHLPFACPTYARVGALCRCAQLLQNRTLHCFPAPKMIEWIRKRSEPPVQTCCSWRPREVR